MDYALRLSENSIYRCPAGEVLRPMPGRKRDTTGKLRIRYVSRRSACRNCPLRQRCLGAKVDRRVIERWEHEAVVDRHRARMTQAEAKAIMDRRKALAEHPFGTLKCRAGYTHFLVRGFEKVRGEWNLMVLCYNFTRVLNIVGLGRFIVWLARYNRFATTRWPDRSEAAARWTKTCLSGRLTRATPKNTPPSQVCRVRRCNAAAA